MFSRRLFRPHERFGWRCPPLRAKSEVVQVLFDNKWIDATVASEEIASIRVNFELDGYEYGMVANTWRKGITPAVLNPVADLRGGHKLSGVVLNRTQHSVFVNISSEIPGMLSVSKLAAVQGANQLEAGNKVDVWVEKVADMTRRATVPLTLIDYKSIEEAISKAVWLDALVSGFNSEDDVFVCVPLHNSKAGLNLTGIVHWEDRKQDLDNGPMPKLDVGQVVKVRVTDAKANGRISFSMIPKKDRKEFLQLLNEDVWLDGEVVKAGPFGLVVKAAHPKTGQLITGIVRMSDWRPMSASYIDDMLGQKVHVRVIGDDAKNQGVLFSMLPESNTNDFVKAHTLFLNATVSGIMDIGLLVLADPPGGGSSGPHTVLVPPDAIPESASGTGYTATKINDASEENDATVVNVVTLHTEKAASKSSISSSPADPGPQNRFSLGDPVKVRVVRRTGSKLVGSMMEVPNVAPFADMTDTDWLDAVVTGHIRTGVQVNVTPASGGAPERGVIEEDEISMGFCRDPSTEVPVGATVRVRVISANAKTGLSLSMVPKQQVEGWSAGSTVYSGIVTDVCDKGALVNLPPVKFGIPVQGLLPTAKMKARQVTLGQQVSVRVTKVRTLPGRIELSLATDESMSSTTAVQASQQTASQSNEAERTSMDEADFFPARFSGETTYGLFLDVLDGSSGPKSTGLLHVTEMTATLREVAELAKLNKLMVRKIGGKANQKLRLTMRPVESEISG